MIACNHTTSFQKRSPLTKQKCDRLKHLPAYITNKSEGEGFCELADLIVQQSLNN